MRVISGKEVREKLLKGAGIVEEAVGSSLGPRGRNSAIKNEAQSTLVVNDGVTIARSINLEDPFENIGAELLKGAAEKTVDGVGDGTTLATILGYAIMKEGIKHIDAGMNPMALRDEINEALEVALKELQGLSKEVSSDEEIEQVASISAADPAIGKLVAQALRKVGKDGVITVEEGNTLETVVEYRQGIQVDKGFLSPHLATELDNPHILMTDMKINRHHQIMPFLEGFAKAGGTDLLIMAGELLEDGLASLVINQMRGTLRICAIQAPAYGETRIDELKDLEAMLGGKSILEHSGRQLDSVIMEELGRAKKVTSDRDKTILVNGGGDPEAVKARIKELRSLTKTAEGFDKDMKEQRLAKLTGGVAVIRVGAATDVELKEKKERVIDAVNATKAAVESGIVAGGEIALFKIAYMDIGSGILSEALKEPFKRLVENSGLDYAEVWKSVKYPVGIDVLDGQVKDLIKAGIIDPTKVLTQALTNAVSVASIAMSTNSLITHVKE